MKLLSRLALISFAGIVLACNNPAKFAAGSGTKSSQAASGEDEIENNGDLNPNCEPGAKDCPADLNNDGKISEEEIQCALEGNCPEGDIEAGGVDDDKENSENADNPDANETQDNNGSESDDNGTNNNNNTGGTNNNNTGGTNNSDSDLDKDKSSCVATATKTCGGTGGSSQNQNGTNQNSTNPNQSGSTSPNQNRRGR